jgi:hypothetical protein
LSNLPVYFTAALLGSGLALASARFIRQPSPLVTADISAGVDSAIVDRCRTGPHGEYTSDDFLRDTNGMPAIEFDRMIETFSLMNCGRPSSRYTLGDFMCDPKFKGMSWNEVYHIVKVTSVARCGQ